MCVLPGYSAVQNVWDKIIFNQILKIVTNSTVKRKENQTTLNYFICATLRRHSPRSTNKTRANSVLFFRASKIFAVQIYGDKFEKMVPMPSWSNSNQIRCE